MPKFINRILCKVFGHKWPEETVYSVKKETVSGSVIQWHCPRCDEHTSGVVLGMNESDSAPTKVNK